MEGLIQSEEGITQQQPVISRKKFKEMVLPKVGDVLCEGLFRVEYVNSGKFRFSSSYRTIVPEIGAHIKIEDRIFEIFSVDTLKKKFNSVFKGFEEKPSVAIPDAPTEEEETLKLI
jgi:hypothetical protein